MRPTLRIDANEFLSDHRIARLSNRELGVYMRLLLFATKDGEIPVSALGALAREEDFAALRPALEPLFRIEDDVWRSHHVERQAKISRIRAKAGKAGGRPAEKAQKTAKPDKLPPCPYQEIVELFHAGMPRSPRVTVLTDARKTRLRVIWRSQENFRDLKFWRAFFLHCSTVPWMRGDRTGSDNQPIPPASLDTLLRPANFPRYVDEAVATWNAQRQRVAR